MTDLEKFCQVLNDLGIEYERTPGIFDFDLVTVILLDGRGNFPIHFVRGELFKGLN